VGGLVESSYVRRVLLILVLLAGCQTAQVTTPRGSLGISWSANTRHGLKAWVEQHEKHWGQPILMLKCHGGHTTDGTWVLTPDYPMPEMPVEHAAWILRAVAQGRLVVIQSCNENGTELYVPDVMYARQTCSAAPDYWHPGWVNKPGQFHKGYLKGAIR
jgi:hypothetical protein